MAMPPEPAWCIQHCWSATTIEEGSCPKCKQEAMAKCKQEAMAWDALTLVEKVEELHKRIEEN